MLLAGVGEVGIKNLSTTELVREVYRIHEPVHLNVTSLDSEPELRLHSLPH